MRKILGLAIMSKILDNGGMEIKIVKFHPGKSKPTQQALEDFETLLEPMLAALELISAGSSTDTFVMPVTDDMWCVRIGSKGIWAFLFYTELPGGVIMCLNGYTKKAKKPPEPSRGGIRRAKYLIKELQHA
jgi:hypothetical protein